MKSLHRISGIAGVGSVLAGLLLSQCTVSAGWPWYRGPLNNGHAQEGIARSWPSQGPEVLWKVPSKGGFSSFAVGGGMAFCLELQEVEGVSQEVLVCREAERGKRLWEQPLGPIKLDPPGRGGNDGAKGNAEGDGPRSTPSIDGNHVYTLSSRLVLQCFEASTGNEVWKRDLLRENAGRNINWGNAASPLVDGDLVFVAGGGPGQSLLAFDKQSGQARWKAFDETMTHATPVPAVIHGKRQVIFFVNSGLLSVDPATGIELWRYPFPFRISTAASPVVAGDIVYCSAGYAVGAGAARISREGEVWKAEEIYRFPGDKPLANHWSTPVLVGDYLYGMFQFKEYSEGPMKCVDVRTGEVKWEKAGFGPGNVIAAGNTLVALSDAGEIVLVDATPTAYTELSRAEVLKGKCWTTPVVAGGRIYARSTEEAVCLDVTQESASR